MKSQPGRQRIAIHILPSISQSKDNQAMKFDQLKEYTIRNIFLENHTQSGVEKLFSFFSNFALYYKNRRNVSIISLNISISCNTLHLEMDFGNLYKKIIVFYIKKITTNKIVQITTNKKLKKNVIAYSNARNSKTACLWSLNLD